MSQKSVTPYRIEWPEKKIDALRERVRAYRLPILPGGAGWKMGCDPTFLDEVRKYWADGYDFAEALERANKFPQVMIEVEPGVHIHCIHVVGEARGERPLLLAHGWPSSVYEFWKVVEPLAYPSRFGGSGEDAFDLVIPSLPGYGPSFKPAQPIASEETAKWYDLAMQKLGYERYFIHGGDIGSDVVWHMGAAKPEALRGLHMNDMKQNKTIPLWPSELKWIFDSKQADSKLGAYFQLQKTKPNSLAYAMVDNPVAQMAWIIERYHDWSDRRARSFESIFTKDELLDYVMMYVMNESFATSIWYYYARGLRGTVDKKIHVPTGMSPFPDPRTPPHPRSYAERNFTLVDWFEPKTGGHFSALEEPQMFTEILQHWGNACEPRATIHTGAHDSAARSLNS